MSTSQFNCDLCLEQIPPSDPRIHCLECSDFDSCATCYAQGYSTDAHSQQHRQEIIRVHGFNCLAPALPQLLEIPPHLLQPSDSEFEARQYFGDLIIPPCQPSPTLFSLASAFFDSVDGHLLPKHSGHLNPEKYYHAHALLGAPPRDNIFQQTGHLASNYLQRQFSLWGLEFFLDSSTSPPTPLLSKTGFAADLAQTIARAPDTMHATLNVALAYLAAEGEELVDPATRLPLRHRYIPRACFPAAADPATAARGEEVLRTLREEVAEGRIVLSEEVWARAQHLSPVVGGARQNPTAEMQQANLEQEVRLMHEARQAEFDRYAISRDRWGDSWTGRRWEYR